MTTEKFTLQQYSIGAILGLIEAMVCCNDIQEIDVYKFLEI